MTRCRDRLARRRSIFEAKRVDPYRARYVLDALLATIREPVGQLVANLVVDDAGNTDPAGLGEGFEPGHNVDSVVEDVVAIGNHIAEIDADAEPNALLVGHFGLAVEHAALHLGGAAHGVDNAGKFRQQPVAGGFDDAAVMLGDLRINQFAAMRLEAFERALLIRPHQARIARHVGGEDRGETAGRGHYSSGTPALRSPAI